MPKKRENKNERNQTFSKLGNNFGELVRDSWTESGPDYPSRVRGYLQLVIKSTLVLVTLVLFSFKTNYKDNEK